MSVHGKGNDGYILLDVLIALFLILIGFGAVFSTLKTAVDYSVKNEKNLTESITLRNDKAEKFEPKIYF
ncbi:MAG: hypothetical protein PF518_10865 [Spirochaetaceae bacterium]|jgi:hypothetical protein|nr:hypothetical protein [Spirochaetaceae bacterium]